MKPIVERIVITRLRDVHGWTTDPVWDNRVSKSFNTTQGLMTAAARVVTSSMVEHYPLMASCLADGDNVLTGCIAYIPDGAKEETIHALTDAFAEQVDLQMANSFEYQLLAA